ncbi:hypothetical protein [Actinomyces stomatis]|uniref:hypothetical protein n=1 Tax=Actinomyces stomatis TaxID=3050227 RepID=UPI0028528FEB|nr:hypothetical protein [Actinomyces sp. PK606]
MSQEGRKVLERALPNDEERLRALYKKLADHGNLLVVVDQPANRIRGLYTQIHPTLEQVLGPWLEHDAILEVIAAWPTPADLKRAGKARTDAGLKARRCKRHATWAGQIISALECQSVTIAGTNAAATVLPHLARQLIAPRAQRADVATQASDPGGRPTLMYQVLTTRARDHRSRPPPTFLAQTLARDLQAPAPTWPPTPAWHQ